MCWSVFQALNTLHVEHNYKSTENNIHNIQIKNNQTLHYKMSTIAAISSSSLISIQNIGSSLRSDMFRAEVSISLEEGQAERPELMLLKMFKPTLFFDSRKLVSRSNATFEEKVQSISRERFEFVDEMLRNAATHIEDSNLESEHLLKIKSILVPDNDLSVGILYEDFEGISLNAILESEDARMIFGGVSLVSKLERLMDIASAVKDLHASDLLHRNLHKDNIIFSEDFSTVKVMDYALDVFQLGAPSDECERKLIEELAISKLTNIDAPPELIKGKAFGEASDVYCFAMIAWQILTGESAKQITEAKEENAERLRTMIVDERLRPDGRDFACLRNKTAAEASQTVQDELAALIEQCWEKMPNNRPTMSEVCESLEKILSLAQ
eukprot:TRINITY_DN3522_c0_g1_i1.p1 TRINITY_DN3522_c0_g1~~TRINITY_DN3522_c0_g1_i1.p1  ORF type:complete len:383 (-),score=130.86 TRINITY_DN3522_c0_g1_i1:1106-2254(-)